MSLFQETDISVMMAPMASRFDLWSAMTWTFMHVQTMYALLSFFLQYECTY